MIEKGLLSSFSEEGKSVSRDNFSLIIVQKPFMERRAYATFMKQWHDENDTNQILPTFKISSPKISLQNYPTEKLSFEQLVNIMVGDVQRIKIYATEEKPFQIPQEMSDEVWSAYEFLVGQGFHWNVVKG